MELIQLIRELTPEGDETRVHLITKSDPERCMEQDESLRKIQESCIGSRVSVEYEYDSSDTIHARSITTDTGWKISLDRGLDIFLRYEISLFSLAASVQEERLTKAFEVTYFETGSIPVHGGRPLNRALLADGRGQGTIWDEITQSVASIFGMIPRIAATDLVNVKLTPGTARRQESYFGKTTGQLYTIGPIWRSVFTGVDGAPATPKSSIAVSIPHS